MIYPPPRPLGPIKNHPIEIFFNTCRKGKGLHIGLFVVQMLWRTGRPTSDRSESVNSLLHGSCTHKGSTKSRPRSMQGRRPQLSTDRGVGIQCLCEARRSVHLPGWKQDGQIYFFVHHNPCIVSPVAISYVSAWLMLKILYFWLSVGQPNGTHHIPSGRLVAYFDTFTSKLKQLKIFYRPEYSSGRHLTHVGLDRTRSAPSVRCI